MAEKEVNSGVKDDYLCYCEESIQDDCLQQFNEHLPPQIDSEVRENPNNQTSLLNDGATQIRKSNRKPILCVISCACLYIAEGVNVSATGPFFPNEAKIKGVTQTMVGIISAVTMCAMWIFSLLLLFIANEKNKKCIFYVGLFLSASTCILFGEAVRITDTNMFIAACITTRVFMGIGCSCIWATGAPILIPLFPKKAGKIFSLLEFCAGFGQMVGPPFGSFLFSIGGYRLPFWVAGLVEIATGLFCVATISFLDRTQLKKPTFSSNVDISNSVLHGSTKSLDTKKNARSSGNALKFMLNPGILLISPALLSVMYEVGFFQVALAPHLLTTFNIDGSTSGNIFLIHAGLAAISTPLFGYLVDRGHSGVLFPSCILLTAFGYIILGLPSFSAFLSSKICLYSGLSLLGLTANGGFIPGYFLLEKIAEIGNVDTQSKIRIYVCAWMNSCYATGSSFGQIVVGGVFFEHFQFYNSCLLLAVLTSLSVVAATVYLWRKDLIRRLLVDNERSTEDENEN